MKQMIVMTSLIGLGLLLFQLIAGPGDSIRGELGQLWQAEIAARQTLP